MTVLDLLDALRREVDRLREVEMRAGQLVGTIMLPQNADGTVAQLKEAEARNLTALTELTKRRDGGEGA